MVFLLKFLDITRNNEGLATFSIFLSLTKDIINENIGFFNENISMNYFQCIIPGHPITEIPVSNLSSTA
jgi:hypothetical protein